MGAVSTLTGLESRPIVSWLHRVSYSRRLSRGWGDGGAVRTLVGLDSIVS